MSLSISSLLDFAALAADVVNTAQTNSGKARNFMWMRQYSNVTNERLNGQPIMFADAKKPRPNDGQGRGKRYCLNTVEGQQLVEFGRAELTAARA